MECVLQSHILQHNIKKLRNNLEKSRPNGVRLLCYGNYKIQWSHLYEAYRWDQSKNSVKLHERLTEVHFNLGYASRMKNHLAEDMLSTNMLNLMKVNNTLCVKTHTDWT